MRAVDTNVLVRLIARDHAAQVKAAEEFVASGAWISHLVLAETLWVLDAVFGMTAQQVAAAVEMLLNHKDLVVQDADVAAAALVQVREKPTIGFSDCLMVEIARKAGHLPLGTFDRKLAKLANVTRIGA